MERNDKDPIACSVMTEKKNEQLSRNPGKQKTAIV